MNKVKKYNMINKTKTHQFRVLSKYLSLWSYTPIHQQITSKGLACQEHSEYYKYSREPENKIYKQQPQSPLCVYSHTEVVQRNQDCSPYYVRILQQKFQGKMIIPWMRKEEFIRYQLLAKAKIIKKPMSYGKALQIYKSPCFFYWAKDCCFKPNRHCRNSSFFKLLLASSIAKSKNGIYGMNNGFLLVQGESQKEVKGNGYYYYNG